MVSWNGRKEVPEWQKRTVVTLPLGTVGTVPRAYEPFRGLQKSENEILKNKIFNDSPKNRKRKIANSN